MLYNDSTLEKETAQEITKKTQITLTFMTTMSEANF